MRKKEENMRLIARYAKDKGKNFEIVTCYDKKIERVLIFKEKPEIETISYQHPSAIWFERKMQDDFGIIIIDAFDRRPLLHHERFPKNIQPMCKDFKEKSLKEEPFEPYEYETIKGDSVFQVSVGPIHAGIIEPGHFHFSQAGEAMLHLEVRHFYKYRAIEKMLEGKTVFEAKAIIERISGNESVAYQHCWRDIVLEATHSKLNLRAKKYHALLLEIERIIHHLTDIGFIPNDAGFGSALAFASKLSEDARRIMQEITGHRFGFGAIDFKEQHIDVAKVKLWLEQLSKDINYFESWIMDIPSLWDRFDTTGRLSPKEAQKYDTVGVVAKASTLAIDRRLDDEFYIKHGFKVVLEKSGDVSARFKVRIKEIQNSITMIEQLLIEKIPAMELNNIEDGEYMAFCESSIGELFMAIDIKEGLIERFFARNPSFVNWQGVHLMMRRDIIADFPLINKSCDLSYAGNDL
ncbi:Formate hydrogenlyase subunit 5 [hydrothermal vent metagenome]|uniref:Formate hydrogenlyase subunit 5 n=1 Tax=hydrothermal vent metagenome TaxID=652676 RepID=A0A1W1CUT6_9ZZZZ